MTKSTFFKGIFVLLCTINLANAGATNSNGDQKMFSASTSKQGSLAHNQGSLANNLNGEAFAERSDIESITDQLAVSAENPYLASLPLIASGELGDSNRYKAALTTMQAQLGKLETAPQQFPSWMHSNSFKAWMWGRVLLAAKSSNDNETVALASKQLSALLEKESASDDSAAFFAWAWGYRAALNESEYKISSEKMMASAEQLIQKSLQQPANHDALSDALWACVMNIAAAANAHDAEKYDAIKKQMLLLTSKTTIAEALNSGLLRTEESNDYPAWALAKLRLAAALMSDQDVYQDLEQVLAKSTEAAKSSTLASAKAEYVLSVLDGELAKRAKNKLETTPKFR